MNTLFLIPSPFGKEQETQTLTCTDYLMPTGATFPDGTVIDAFCVPVLLTGDGLRIYAIRCNNALLIFSPEGREGDRCRRCYECPN